MTEQEAIDWVREQYVIPRTGEWVDDEESRVMRTLVESLERRIAADA